MNSVPEEQVKTCNDFSSMTYKANCPTALKKMLLKGSESEMQFVAQALQIETVHLADANSDENELVVLCLVRDGSEYISTFIEHHFRIGASHIVFLDNWSQDHTVARALAYPGVSVLKTPAAYKDFKQVMKTYLIRRFASEKWSLTVDIDELFEYPYYNSLTLCELLGYLNRKGFTAVVGQMLDMFPDSLLQDSENQECTDFSDTHCYFDTEDIRQTDYPECSRDGNTVSNPDIKFHFGGLRKRLFGLENVCLTKHPLIKLVPGLEPFFHNSHMIAGGMIADFSCILRHFKFLPRFRERVRLAVKRKNYYKDSYEYVRYQEKLGPGFDPDFKTRGMKRYSGTDALLAQGFIVASDHFRSRFSTDRQHTF